MLFVYLKRRLRHESENFTFFCYMTSDGVGYTEHTVLKVGAALGLVPEHHFFRGFSIDSKLAWLLVVRRLVSNLKLNCAPHIFAVGVGKVESRPAFSRDDHCCELWLETRRPVFAAFFSALRSLPVALSRSGRAH